MFAEPLMVVLPKAAVLLTANAPVTFAAPVIVTIVELALSLVVPSIRTLKDVSTVVLPPAVTSSIALFELVFVELKYKKLPEPFA